MRDKNPHKKGILSEAMFLAACVAQDIPVSVPYGINSRYDFIIEIGGLRRVQVKTGRIKPVTGSIEFNVCSSKWEYGSIVKRIGSRSYQGQIDDFGVYVHDLRRAYLFPFEAIKSNRTATFNMEKIAPFEFYRFGN